MTSFQLPSVKFEDTIASNGFVNNAVILLQVGRPKDALECLNKALEINPGNVHAYQYQAMTLSTLGIVKPALECYERAITLKPDIEWLWGLWLHLRMLCCIWDNLDDNIGGILERIDKRIAPPFTLMGFTDSPELLQRGMKAWIDVMHPPIVTERPKYARHDKIRIGYYSSDFFNHATMHLLVGVLEKHDRDKFEVTAFSFDGLGEDRRDSARTRVQKAVDKFIDVRTEDEPGIAKLSREMEIDIAIDLKGSTKEERMGIFAHRAAPIQVNYLGYPGTLVAPYMDYLVADRYLIPASQRQYYSEKIVYMPDSYQANDDQREINGPDTRAAWGLPEAGFIFACFNAAYKFTPAVFDVWCRLLKSVEGSVLWLLKPYDLAIENLRKEAEARGVDGTRLIFAKGAAPPIHLARHRLVDLSLDTFPVNAHTTFSDSLWAGVPMVTLCGDSFASRVGLSLLQAIGLQSLIAGSLGEYEAIAGDLARNPDRLAALRARLAENRRTHPLFNTERYTRNWERALIAMYERDEKTEDIWL